MISIAPSGFLVHSLHDHPEGDKVASILAASLERVDPGRCVRDNMSRSADRISFQGRYIDLSQVNRVLLVAFGKASLPMAQAAAELLGSDLSEGIVIAKEAPAADAQREPARCRVIRGGHPFPDQQSLQAGRAVMDLLQDTSPDDLVLFLISGGGSALLSMPAAGISLEEFKRVNEVLLACGANIGEINTVRKHISQVKGGQLAGAAAPAEQISLVLSDVVGDPLDMIASGPTVPDTTTFEDALQVIETYHLERDVPSSVLAHLKNGTLGRLPDTPKPGDQGFERSTTLIIGNNLLAARAGIEQAQEAGFHALHLTSRYQGEARTIGSFMAGVLQQMAETGDPLPRPACLVAGGEATVTLEKDAETGLGGRNQEIALSAVRPLAGVEDAALVAFASDGNDGPTDAAGAVATGETYQRGRSLGLHAADYLKRHDAYHYFEALDDLLMPGLTETNVNDLVFLFTF